jgi:acyl-homoserine lactone acylase PvdQ
MDVFDILAPAWQAALQDAVSTVGKEKMDDAEFAAAVDAILKWDGQFTANSTAAPLIRFWRLKCEKAVDTVAIADKKPLSDADKAKFLDLLAQTIADVKAKYGKWNITWGDINLIGRDGKYFPCDGAEFGSEELKTQTETVHDVNAKEIEKGSGKYVANNGSGTMLIAFMRPEGAESYTLVAWGESADPNSPHHNDQAEKLYGSRQVKPTWFKKEDLMQHKESEKVLTLP